MNPVTSSFFDKHKAETPYISLSHWGLFDVGLPCWYETDYESNVFGLRSTQTLNGVTYAVHYN